jgi:ribosomal protein S18 acetylase RimI-like enzyme
MKSAVKHGLVMQRLVERLRLIGVHVTPFLLFREGARAQQTEWPGLASEFPSSVLKISDIAAVAALTRWNTEQIVRARLAKGDLCIVLKHGDEIAGYTWADLERVSDSTFSFALGPGEAYLYDAYVAPQFRGRSLAPYLRAESYKHLRAAGRNVFYSISDFFNTPAIKFKRKLDAEVVRLYLQIQLGGRSLGQWVLRDYDRARERQRLGQARTGHTVGTRCGE